MSRLFGTICASVVGFALSTVVGLPVVQSAQAESLVEKVLRWDASTPLPECVDDKVLTKIVKRFNKAEDKTWKRGFHIQSVDRINQRRIDERVDEYGEPPLIPKRYCQARATMTNGSTYSMHYFIEAKSGLVGYSWGAEFCIHGLDPWKVYDGRCRVAH